MVFDSLQTALFQIGATKMKSQILNHTDGICENNFENVNFKNTLVDTQKICKSYPATKYLTIFRLNSYVYIYK